MKSYRIVEYDYDSLPESWKSEKHNKFQDMQFILIGKAKGIMGRIICCPETGYVDFFYKENVKNVEV